MPKCKADTKVEDNLTLKVKTIHTIFWFLYYFSIAGLLCRLCSPPAILDSRRVLVNEFHLVISRHNSEANDGIQPEFGSMFILILSRVFIKITPFWQTTFQGTMYWYHILGSEVTSSLSKCIICQVDLVISVSICCY